MAPLVDQKAISSHFRKKQQDKGRDAATHHVLKFDFDPRTSVCTGTVHASQKDKQYQCKV